MEKVHDSRRESCVNTGLSRPESCEENCSLLLDEVDYSNTDMAVNDSGVWGNAIDSWRNSAPSTWGMKM
jgi:hypothetical protein